MYLSIRQTELALKAVKRAAIEILDKDGGIGKSQILLDEHLELMSELNKSIPKRPLEQQEN